MHLFSVMSSEKSIAALRNPDEINLTIGVTPFGDTIVLRTMRELRRALFVD
jgi:hypothetical protein